MWGNSFSSGFLWHPSLHSWNSLLSGQTAVGWQNSFRGHLQCVCSIRVEDTGSVPSWCSTPQLWSAGRTKGHPQHAPKMCKALTKCWVNLRLYCSCSYFIGMRLSCGRSLGQRQVCLGLWFPCSSLWPVPGAGFLWAQVGWEWGIFWLHCLRGNTSKVEKSSFPYTLLGQNGFSSVLGLSSSLKSSHRYLSVFLKKIYFILNFLIEKADLHREIDLE